LDADLARLYGVPTKRFNEAFKRNHQRFPHDFAFQLTKAELNNLRLQLAASNLHPIESVGDNPELVAICDPFQPTPWRSVSPMGIYRTRCIDGEHLA
jgi:hypothetical protein